MERKRYHDMSIMRERSKFFMVRREWFYHEDHTERGPRDNTPPLMVQLRELYVEARDSGRMDIFALESVVAKGLYAPT